MNLLLLFRLVLLIFLVLLVGLHPTLVTSHTHTTYTTQRPFPLNGKFVATLTYQFRDSRLSSFFGNEDEHDDANNFSGNTGVRLLRAMHYSSTVWLV